MGLFMIFFLFHRLAKTSFQSAAIFLWQSERCVGPAATPRTEPSLSTRRVLLRKNTVNHWKSQWKSLTQLGHTFKSQARASRRPNITNQQYETEFM